MKIYFRPVAIILLEARKLRDSVMNGFSRDCVKSHLVTVEYIFFNYAIKNVQNFIQRYAYFVSVIWMNNAVRNSVITWRKCECYHVEFK